MTKNTGNVFKFSTGRTTLFALILLALLNLLNQLDRRGLVTIFPLLQQEWGFSDAQLGLIISFITLGRSLITIPSGWLADRIGVIKILRPVAFLWSFLAIVSGLAANSWTFFITRVGIGLADGVNGPLDLAYLGKISPKNRRGVVLSIYSIALYVGSGLGLIFAGFTGERYGWRWVLIIPGALAMVISFGLWGLPHLPVKNFTTASKTHFSKIDLRFLKPLFGVFLGGSLGVFASTALISWLPTYFTRRFELSLTQTGLLTGGIILPASMLGAVAGGFLSDRLSLGHQAARYLISAAGLGCAMVCGLVGLCVQNVSSTVIWFFISTFCFTLPVSPLLVLIQDNVPENKLATSQAIFGIVTQVIGAAPATVLVGLVSDWVGLQTALILPFLATGMGGLLIAFSRRTVGGFTITD